MRPNFRQVNQFLISFSTKQLIVIAVIVCVYWAYTWWNLASLERRSSAQLKEEILHLSEQYVRALAREHKDVVDGPYSGRLTAYDLKRTMAVLLQNILERLSKLEHKISNATVLLVNESLVPFIVESDSPKQISRVVREVDINRLALTSRGVRSVSVGSGARKAQVGAVGGKETESVAEEEEEMDGRRGGAGSSSGGSPGSWCGAGQTAVRLPNTMRSLWPECDEKMEWMRRHWKSDACYANYGVDGSACSFFFYLSEVESFCPRILTRGKNTFRTNITITYVKPRSDGESLFSKLATQVRGPYAAAFRAKLATTWPRMLAASQYLIQRGDIVGSRPRLRIAVFPYILSNNSHSKRYPAELNEESRRYMVRQWVELIASLHLLGHRITLCNSEEELKSVLGGFPDTKSPCQARKNLFLDLLFTDHAGLGAFREHLGDVQYTRFSCLLRILDPFSTEPAFNYRIRSNACPLCGANLNPKQFLSPSAADLTPDNTFLGHVVVPGKPEPPVTIPGDASRPVAILHVTRDTPPPSAGLMAAIRRHFRVVAASMDSSPPIASFPALFKEEWQLGLSWAAFVRYLSSAQLMVGLGWPLESPVAMEALASGCSVVVPIRSKPVPLGNLSEGWPSSRPVSSQFGYLLRHVREPYVIRLSPDDAGSSMGMDRLFDQIAAKILARAERLKAFVAPEFTAEAYLQRLDAHLRKQDFCEGGGSGGRELWPPLKAISYYLGVLGDSCEETCRKRGLICEPAHFSGINSRIELQERGLRCERIAFDASPLLPHFLPDKDTCAFQSEPRLFSCASGLPTAMRLCPCRDGLPGQSALCAQCL